jgi:hypothetical protein
MRSSSGSFHRRLFTEADYDCMTVETWRREVMSVALCSVTVGNDQHALVLLLCKKCQNID